jgi:hypothetical protein
MGVIEALGVSTEANVSTEYFLLANDFSLLITDFISLSGGR